MKSKVILNGLCILAITLVFFRPSKAQTSFPHVYLQNEELKTLIYLPDAKKGYYRGTRFDWSGVVGSLKFKGHEYFSHWLDKHDPLVHESIQGPVEAFVPIGYENAKVGDNFIAIGIGKLRKETTDPYRFATPYKVTDHGKWKVRKSNDQIEFTHKLSSKEGISYRYKKTVRLVPGEAKLVLEHTLFNTGSDSIVTSVYNHNFFVIDNEPTGPNIRTRFPYEVQAEGKGFGDMVTTQDSSIIFNRELKKGESVFTGQVHGVGETPEDYDITIENLKSRIGVRITGDQPLSKLVYWASATTACPEPYLAINIGPGKSHSWTITYVFFAL